VREGMLFHSLYNSPSDAYFRQLSVVLQGDLNITACEQTWQRILDRHPILRTAFILDHLGEALQVVHKRVQVPLETLDWRSLSSDEREQKLAGFLQAEQARSFDTSRVPLMRLFLIREGQAAYRFVW